MYLTVFLFHCLFDCLFKDAKYGRLHLLTCSRDDLEECLKTVRQQIHITRTAGETTQITTCGIGVYQLNEKIQEAFDVK